MTRVGDRIEGAIEHRADLGRELQEGAPEPPPRRNIVRTAIWLAITAVSLYLVAPSLIEVAGSWKSITTFNPAWLGVMALLQVATLACVWVLQRLSVHARSWQTVIESQLAGNAISKIAPGGGAVGAALQYRMLVQGGIDRTTAVGGLAAASLLTFAVVLALPVVAIPAVLRGSVSRTLVETSVLAGGAFILLAALGAASFASDRPLAWAGRTIQRVRNRLRRHAEPLRNFPARLLSERDRILASIGPRWKGALLATIGRWAFDYATLLAALAAVGSRPRPVLVLLAFCAAQVLAQIPVTPGGLGFVEAGLTAMLALAGVNAEDAVVATFAYRLFSYWLPLPAGIVAYVVYQRRRARTQAATGSA
jgi:uncharacterized protein (TIRG00374 family)